MCCSVSPNIEVRFSNTILYAAEVVDLQGETVHVLGYQNRAQNNVQRLSLTTAEYPAFKPTGFWNKLRGIFGSDSPKTNSAMDEETTGNAMILPFPCLPQTMSKANVLDTKNCPDILKDIAKAVKPPPAYSRNMPPVFYGSQKAVEVFEAAGIYTVVLAQDARDIPDALSQVPKEKRPKLNPKLFDAYAKWYSDWTIALCCFNNEDAKEALPMLWWYQPMNPEKLFLPALDCHTGNVPKLNADVLVDHTLAVGSFFAEAQSKISANNCPQCEEPNSQADDFCLFCGSPLRTKELNFQETYKRVSYQNTLSTEVKPYLLSKVMGRIYNRVMPNGDFVCQIDEVRKGIWNPVRSLPPSAN